MMRGAGIQSGTAKGKPATKGLQQQPLCFSWQSESQIVIDEDDMNASRVS